MRYHTFFFYPQAILILHRWNRIRLFIFYKIKIAFEISKAILFQFFYDRGISFPSLFILSDDIFSNNSSVVNSISARICAISYPSLSLQHVSFSMHFLSSHFHTQLNTFLFFSMSEIFNSRSIQIHSKLPKSISTQAHIVSIS